MNSKNSSQPESLDELRDKLKEASPKILEPYLTQEAIQAAEEDDRYIEGSQRRYSKIQDKG